MFIVYPAIGGRGGMARMQEQRENAEKAGKAVKSLPTPMAKAVTRTMKAVTRETLHATVKGSGQRLSLSTTADANCLGVERR